MPMLCDRLLKCGLVTGAPLGHSSSSERDRFTIFKTTGVNNREKQDGCLLFYMTARRRENQDAERTKPQNPDFFVSYIAAPSEKNVLKAQSLVPGTAINK